VAAGSYNVTVAAGGFRRDGERDGGSIESGAGGAVLQVAPVTSTIEVTPPPKELRGATEVGREQRVLGVFPHFLVTYDPNRRR